MTIKKQNTLILAMLSCMLAAPNPSWADVTPDQNNPKGAEPASGVTIEKNKHVFEQLPFINPVNVTEDYILAAKGLVASSANDSAIIKGIKADKQEIIWDFAGFAFEGSKPVSATDYKIDSVNPSLWRQAILNNNQGLFKVMDKRADSEANIYQIRGFDLANMTIIEAKHGIIVLDTLTSKETAAAAIEFYNAHRGREHYNIKVAKLTKSQDVLPGAPILAVIYSHSHIDHFGGAEGVIKTSDVQNLEPEQSVKSDGSNPLTLEIPKDNKSYVIAPSGFINAAVSENVYVGNAMGRRSEYMYGTPLLGGKKDSRSGGEKGHVDAGLGKALSSGTATMVPPSVIIEQDRTVKLDDVTMEFQLTPNTEAPAEMTVYFKEFKALNMGEIACPLMHNLLTMRGSQVRDALQWSNYLTQSLDRYGADVDVMLGQHNWPRWGNQSINTALANQRDSYKYIHDQSLRLTNQGYTMNDLAEMVVMPDSLKKEWYNQGYYGSLKHNVKAIYQKYIGWYDANPAHLDPLTDKAASKKYIEYMGGMTLVMEKAKVDFDKGNYRWVAQVMNNAVFAEPDYEPAKKLQAAALEQLGYQAEASTWRNAYLMSANELRNGISTPKDQSEDGVATSLGSNASTFTAMTIPMIFDFTAIRLNGPKANGKKIAINWTITDCAEKTATNQSNEIAQYEAYMCGNYAMIIENSTLVYMPEKDFPKLYDKAINNPEAISLKLTRKQFNALMVLQMNKSKKNESDTSVMDAFLQKISNHVGGAPKEKLTVLSKFFALLDAFTPDFPIVWPQPDKVAIDDRN